MFNNFPGQGLGYTASKEIAFGLGNFGGIILTLGLIMNPTAESLSLLLQAFVITPRRTVEET